MINIKSKFKLLAVLIASFLTILPPIAIYLSYISPEAGMILPIVFLLFIIIFWLTVFRTRAHKLAIDNKNIIVNKYFGLGKSKVYDISKLDGFITSFESGKLGVSEFLFILENGKRVACISSFYQSNFDELKEILKRKMLDLGEKEYSSKEERTEVLR